MSTIKTANIGGIDVNFLKQVQILPVIDGWRRAARRGYVVLTNPHSVMMCKRDAKMREATSIANITLPDGVGIVVAARILGHGKQYRVTGPALMLQVCDEGRSLGLRHFFYGGSEDVASRLPDAMIRRFPGLKVAGSLCPPFRDLTAAEDAAMVNEINAAKPDVVWIGLGAPKQEKWMTGHLGRIHATAMIGVGAAFDFHSGKMPWAPAWMRRTGTEWAYRFAKEPRRMWRRNLDSPLFLAAVFGQAVQGKLSRLVSRTHPLSEPVYDSKGLLLPDERA